jgi:hypothetical protein
MVARLKGPGHTSFRRQLAILVHIFVSKTVVAVVVFVVVVVVVVVFIVAVVVATVVVARGSREHHSLCVCVPLNHVGLADVCRFASTLQKRHPN